MADNTVLSAAVGVGDTIASDDIAGVKFGRTKITLGADGVNDLDVSSANPMPVTGTLTAVTTVTTVSAVTTVNALIPGTGATNLGKAADAIAGATDTGVAPLAIRDDALAAITPIEGDYAPLRVDANGALWVVVNGTLTVGSHAVTNAGTFAVQAAQSGTWTVQPGNTANTMAWLVTGTGGTFPATQSGTWTVQPGNTPNTTAWLTSDRPATSGGLTIHRTISAATTNATSVKASAGQVYELFVTNINAAVRYLKLYNKASAPTVGTDTPVLTLAIPGNTAGAGFSKHVPNGYAFSLGIAFALTTGVADADTGAVAASEIVVNLGFA